MKRTAAIASIFSLSCFAALSVPRTARAEKDVVNVTTHEVTSGGRPVSDAQPGSLPSPAHPEGTVFGITSTDDRWSELFIDEIDVARSETIHRQRISCAGLHHAGDRVYATCGAELVAFDAASLAIVWRVGGFNCPNVEANGISEISTGGSDLIGVLADCHGTVYAHVVRTNGEYLGGTPTPLPIDARYRHKSPKLEFAGQTAVIMGWLMLTPVTIVVLSRDYRRIASTLKLGTFQDASVKDGQIHATDNQSPGITNYGQPDIVKGPSWLLPGRDYTLTMALRPVGSTPTAPEPPNVYHVPSHVSGSYTQYEFQLGSEYFFMAGACCGSDPGGLYAGPLPQ